MIIQKISSVTGRAVPVPGDDIDTDRIIPARFLKCVTFDALGEQVFLDERFQDDGTSKNHPIDDAHFKGANIILTGDNFGCGSSREHAPQAIKRAGFDAVIAESFAEIFHGNSVTLGVVPVIMQKKLINEIMDVVNGAPQTELTIDIDALEVTAGEKTWPMTMKESARRAFLDGTYDSLGLLRAGADKVAAFEAALPYRLR